MERKEKGILYSLALPDRVRAEGAAGWIPKLLTRPTTYTVGWHLIFRGFMQQFAVLKVRGSRAAMEEV